MGAMASLVVCDARMFGLDFSGLVCFDIIRLLLYILRV